MTALFTNAPVGIRTRRILREKGDCKQSSLIDEDTGFGVALDKGTNRQGRSLLIYLFFSYNREERKVDKLLFFLGDILIGFKHHIFVISNEKGKWQEHQR